MAPKASTHRARAVPRLRSAAGKRLRAVPAVSARARDARGAEPVAEEEWVSAEDEADAKDWPNGAPKVWMLLCEGTIRELAAGIVSEQLKAKAEQCASLACAVDVQIVKV